MYVEVAAKFDIISSIRLDRSIDECTVNGISGSQLSTYVFRHSDIGHSVSFPVQGNECFNYMITLLSHRKQKNNYYSEWFKQIKNLKLCMTSWDLLPHEKWRNIQPEKLKLAFKNM